jgi:hypothetical protein
MSSAECGLAPSTQQVLSSRYGGRLFKLKPAHQNQDANWRKSAHTTLQKFKNPFIPDLRWPERQIALGQLVKHPYLIYKREC